MGAENRLDYSSGRTGGDFGVGDFGRDFGGSFGGFGRGYTYNYNMAGAIRKAEKWKTLFLTAGLTKQ